MKKTIEVLNQMAADKVIGNYAIGGAIAAYNYIEATMTEDLDIIVSFDGEARPSGLVMLTPIISYLRGKGYTECSKEGIVIDGWPVQFLPVASALDAESLAGATTIDLEMPNEGKVSTRILTAEHVMATALNIGRPKDYIRINQFIEGGVFDAGMLCLILERHGLKAKWAVFCHRFDIVDPCRSMGKP
jgi:hypothetical protein